MRKDNELQNNINPPADRDAPPYTRREWYYIGFKDGYEKALKDLKNKVPNKMDT